MRWLVQIRASVSEPIPGGGTNRPCAHIHALVAVAQVAMREDGSEASSQPEL